MFRHDINWSNMQKAIKYPRQAIDDTLIEALVRTPSTYLNTKTTIGTNVFSRDWDILILLDTCRVDALEAVAPEYDFLSDVGSIRSVGGRSPEWIAKTFEERYEETIRNTAYLSANVFSKQILADRHHESASLSDNTLSYRLLERLPTVDVDTIGRFEYLYQYEPVGEDGPRGHKEGGTPPRYVTDRGIAVNRNYDYDRIILHYLQPHPPYFANALREGRDLDQHEHDWWGFLGETGDFETIWNTYLDELRFVLDEVELLLENVDAEMVAISADHGESFGEYWEYGHKTGSLNPTVRTVPWVETSATDTGGYSPSIASPVDSGPETPDESVEDQLEALGYRM